MEADMDKQALLVELRRVGDEFRSVEKTVLELKNLLAGSGLTAPTRARAEAMWSSKSAELMRLGQQRLELDVTPSHELERALKGTLARDARVGHVQT
jgi:hypothetical protein